MGTMGTQVGTWKTGREQLPLLSMGTNIRVFLRDARNLDFFHVTYSNFFKKQYGPNEASLRATILQPSCNILHHLLWIQKTFPKSSTSFTFESTTNTISLTKKKKNKIYKTIHSSIIVLYIFFIEV